MGICSSCQSNCHVATAKLVLQDGRLMEFSQPVKVGYVLQKNPMCFICNSDDMDFDDVVAAISADEELQLGHLYFALPLTWLRRPLQAEQMAALAVKASSALMRSGGSFLLSGEWYRRSVAAGDSSGVGVGTRRRRSGGRKFSAKLSTIDE